MTRQQQAMAKVEANGLVIGYDLHGSGPPLVLLHGATSSGREDFAAQVPLLSQAFRLYLPDARGHATTRWDADEGFEYGWLVDDAEAFVDRLGLATFHLVGFSMGALTALGLAIHRPERLRTLALVGVGMAREPRNSVARRLMDPDRIVAHDPAWAAELARRHDPVQGEGAWRRLLTAITRDIARQALPEPRLLHRIDCPTLVAVGDRDPFVPVDQAWALARQLPDSRLLVVPACGHEVQVRRPALFNEALAGFYRSTEAIATARAGVGAGGDPGRPAVGSTVRPASSRSSAREAAGPPPPATPDAERLGGSPDAPAVVDTGRRHEEAS